MTTMICIRALLVLWSGLVVIARAASVHPTKQTADGSTSILFRRWRGGSKWSEAEDRINAFLHSCSNDARSETKGEFYIQGWRWHTMSLAREAGRLQDTAQRLARKSSFEPLSDEILVDFRKAADYVVNFNMKGLHKIEKDLFFPWVKKRISTASLDDHQVAVAFEAIMDQLEADRKVVERLGRNLNHALQKSADNPKVFLQSVASTSGDIVNQATSMLQTEDAFLVPVVAKLVPESEQKSFNSRVIRNLGILDSRLHLVAMHEAVWALNSQAERATFEKAIPSISQMMIPRWKRLLYEPQVRVLNTF